MSGARAWAYAQAPMDSPARLARDAWFAAVRDGPVAGALEKIYADAASAIKLRAPACWASGRCCNFIKTGHLLYCTGLEAAYTLTRAGAPARERLDAALRAGGCPYQVANLCGVHASKPLGCRLYFCDRSSQEWQHELYERLTLDLRALHDRFAVPYVYAEWRELLGEMVGG